MKRIAGLGICVAAVVLLAQCRAPWHTLDNPVDPESPTYIGTPSVDNNGNGIPQYIDVEEIELIAPADDAVLETVTPVLKTYLFDPALVKRYWIQIATDSGFANVVYDDDSLPSNATTVPLGKLNNNLTYFWRAMANDGTKWSAEWSPTWVFSIHLDLGVPGNPSPADGANVGDATPELDWADVAGADGYQIQIDNSELLAAPFIDVGTSAFQVTLPLSKDTTYYWRVRIKKDNQWGDWSPVWWFATLIAPEINVKQDVTGIPDGTGSFAFGSVLIGGSGGAVTFTVENQGTDALILSGTPKVAISGTDAAMFVVNPQPTSPIVPDGNSAFTITFNPSTPGPKNATVTIANSDGDENPYDFAVTGTGITPEINVTQEVTSVPDGGSFPFGNVLLGTSSSFITFRIQNLGTADLHLDGAPKVAISGADALMFTVRQQPTSPIAPGDNSTFDIVFTPGSLGAKTATVTIENDDTNEAPYDFTITGAGVAPEINVKQGATNIASGGAFDFGNQRVAAGKPIVFTVENLGTANLLLNGTPKVAVSGANPTMFVVNSQPGSPVAPSGSTPFTITFTPASVGPKTALVTIANDDSDEGSYTFTVNGTGITPEINVKQGATSIASGGSYNFGNQRVAAGKPIVFTVENLGTDNLLLTGTPKVLVSGTHASMFVVNPQPGSPVAPSGSTTFTITFTPGSLGAKTATVTIANDDSDEGSYTFTVNGTGIAPEINVKQDATSIASGGTYDFGNQRVAAGKAIPFTVENLGTDDLLLTGTPKVVVSGANPTMFVVSPQPGSPVAPSGSTPFTITFTPTNTGAKTAVVTIANDDSDEGSYTFTVNGTGIAPEINVKQGATSIASGGSYDFGNQRVAAGKAIVFTVENLGTDDLLLTGTPKVVVSGANPTMFVVNPQPGSPVAPSGSTPFTITFTPTSLGAKTATVTIANDDSDEGSYTFAVNGAGVAPEINVKQGVTGIASGGSYDFGNQRVAAGKAIVFTVENLGTDNLLLTGTPKVVVSGTNPTMFVVSPQPGSPVVPSGSTTFTITFTPGSPDVKTAVVTIANDDSDEGSYTFTVNGTGIAPEINVKQGPTNIASGGAYDFGNQRVAAGKPIVFTVENLGTDDLLLTGTPKVAVSGTNPTMFVVSPQPGSPVVPSGSTTFTITFTPTSVGAKTALVTIANDDSDEGSYTFTVNGTGIAPEINVKQGVTSIASGGTYAFGNQRVAAGKEVVFTVENLGTDDLLLTGTPKVAVGGVNPTMFVVNSQPGSPVAPSGNTTFTITFTPTSVGAKTATVTIANDDSDEGSYTFTVNGTGIAPEINVKQGVTSIASGGTYAFGNQRVGVDKPIVFTVENLGTDDLLLTGTPKVAVSGTHASMFVVNTEPVSPVAPSGSTPFTITFTPGSLGAKTATVTIASDDSDEGSYTFDLSGTGVEPEINVKQGATGIASGGTCDFGNQRVAAGRAIVFTVENLGTANLILNGTPKVLVLGTHASMFVVSPQPGSPVVPSGSTTFTITFTPGSPGEKNASAIISNDDEDENPYVLNLAGTGVAPEINVKQGTTDIASGGSYGFGNQRVAAGKAIVFTVENLGTDDLLLTGTPKVAVSGANPTMFVVSPQPGSPVVPSGSTTFTITFTPGSLGAKTATVTIANDDANENPYTFTVNGTGIAPEINVKQGTTSIASGGSYDFGIQRVAAGKAIVFTVENLGTGDLLLTGTPKVEVSGTHASMFVVNPQPDSPVAPSGSTTFTITFTPTSVGAKTALVTIANDDSDEGSYTFTVNGTGIAPEINVKQGTTGIGSGGSYDFGNQKATTSGSPVVFRIENLGTADLNLTGTPKVSIGGTDASMFVVNAQPGSPIAPSGSTTFEIVFTPGSAGSKSASLSIASDDGDENPYTIDLQGAGIVPDMNVWQGFSSIESGGSHDFGAVLTGTSGPPATFSIENLGEADLILDGSPKVSISGPDASLFSVAVQPASPVAPSGSVSFDITFSPGTPGPKSATVSIANDDPDEDPYTFTLSGVGGTAPEINVFHGSTNLPSGGGYAFGDVLLGSGGVSVIFTVENLGSANLNLTGNPKVDITGSDAGMFAVDTQPASPIGSLANSSFTITFTPTSVGAKSATVTIANDDADENPYTFTLTGNGIGAEMDVLQGGTGIPSGTGVYDFSDVAVSDSSPAITFTVKNLGTMNLDLSGIPIVDIIGADAAMFSVQIQPVSPILPSGSTTFTIVFSPDSTGIKQATVSIVSNDADENPYTFEVRGRGT